MTSPVSVRDGHLARGDRPVASILLFAYNHESFIEEALLSALRQDVPGFELIVVDDASTDATREIIERVLAQAAPPGLVVRKLFKERNGGLLAAVNDAMAMAAGPIFMAMAGDDISLPDRLARTLGHFEGAPDVQLVYGECIKVDAEGRHLSKPVAVRPLRRFSYDQAPLGRIYASASPFGAAAAYRRELYDFFGPMVPGTHGEDNCYWIRALLLGVVVRDSACYIHWRQHGNNLSNFAVKGHCGEWQRRHLRWMELHATFSPQWRTDIRLARERGIISAGRAWRLRWAGAREDRTWALEVSSLRCDPWAHWGWRALALLRVGRFSSTRNFFRLRLSEVRREHRWQFWVKIKSNPQL